MIEAYVRGLLEPVYNVMGSSYPLIIGAVALFIVFYLFSKIKAIIRAKRAKRYKVGTTNSWFKWEEYYEWKREIEESKKQGKK